MNMNALFWAVSTLSLWELTNAWLRSCCPCTRLSPLRSFHLGSIGPRNNSTSSHLQVEGWTPSYLVLFCGLYPDPGPLWPLHLSKGDLLPRLTTSTPFHSFILPTSSLPHCVTCQSSLHKLLHLKDTCMSSPQLIRFFFSGKLKWGVNYSKYTRHCSQGVCSRLSQAEVKSFQANYLFPYDIFQTMCEVPESLLKSQVYFLFVDTQWKRSVWAGVQQHAALQASVACWSSARLLNSESTLELAILKVTAGTDVLG